MPSSSWKKNKFMDNKDDNKIKRSIDQLDIRPLDPKKERLFWGSVIFFAILVAVIWLWGMKAKIEQINLEASQEEGLWDNTKKIWDEVFNASSS